MLAMLHHTDSHAVMPQSCSILNSYIREWLEHHPISIRTIHTNKSFHFYQSIPQLKAQCFPSHKQIIPIVLEFSIDHGALQC
jgi:hypothetical protein